jgi:hypothetical protein
MPQTTILGSWIVGMIVAEDSIFLPTDILLYNPLWHMMGSHKHLSLAKVTTTNISANKMARLDGNMPKVEAQQLKGGMEEIDLLLFMTLGQQNYLSYGQVIKDQNHMFTVLH